MAVEPAAVSRPLSRPTTPWDGVLHYSENTVEEAASALGRHFAGVGTNGFREAVGREVATECEAVAAGERGDLTGRAQQAVAMSPTDMSPVQVAAADLLFHEISIGSERLLTDVEPTAASGAGTRWLKAAAEVTGTLCGREPEQIFALADEINVGSRVVAQRVSSLLVDHPAQRFDDAVRDAVQVGAGQA